jgi:hypothetical protein
LRVQLEGQAGALPEILVNNQARPATATPTGWYVDVPAATVAAMGERRLVVTLGRAGQQPLTLTGVSLVPF